MKQLTKDNMKISTIELKLNCMYINGLDDAILISGVDEENYPYTFIDDSNNRYSADGKSQCVGRLVDSSTIKLGCYDLKGLLVDPKRELR